jgi:hypothetical protein
LCASLLDARLVGAIELAVILVLGAGVPVRSVAERHPMVSTGASSPPTASRSCYAEVAPHFSSFD